MTDLPAFSIHNEATSDFTIPQNNDLGLIGEYIVRIRSEIQVPDDHTGTTFTTKFDEYDFIIQVEECTVDDYTADKVIKSFSYHIGAPDFTSPKYSFIETPACQYPETVILTNLPAFVLHNEDTADFTILQNNDLSILGSYTVTLRSEIYIPDDYMMTSFTTMRVEYDFIIYIEPCLVSTYEATKKVQVIVYNVGQPDKTDGYYVFDESPVCNYPETVTLRDLPAFVQHNEPTSDFTIPLNRNLDIIGGYTVTIRSEISIPDDYSASSFTTMHVEYEFLVQIEECLISGYEVKEAIQKLTYIIGDPLVLS